MCISLCILDYYVPNSLTAVYLVGCIHSVLGIIMLCSFITASNIFKSEPMVTKFETLAAALG